MHEDQQDGPTKFKRTNIKNKTCVSLDLRSRTAGDVSIKDETTTHASGDHAFSTSVFSNVAEIKIRYGKIDISLVGELTTRDGVLEITPEHIAAAMSDHTYRDQLVEWIQNVSI